ncbi:hypothetical protein HK101_008936 [Irineochytrium annulatum]|nr:hypothetical protein HK101_008936 [Irineochytrium annulatum]
MSAKVVCDACKAVAGYSADKAVAEQAVEKSPEHEFVCWRCVEVFDFCVECEGAGTYRSGQWRPRPLFVSGPHRPCALRHATSGENHKKLQIITTRCNPSTSSPSHALSGFNLTSAAAPPPNLARPLRDVLHLYDEMLWSTISPRVVRASPWLADWSQWEQRRAAGHLELTRFIVGPSDPGAGDVRTFLAVGYRVRPQPRAGRGSGAQRQQSMSSVASSSSSTSVSVSPKRRRGRKDDTIASGVGGGLVGGLQDTVPAAAAFLSWHASAGHVQLGTVGILGRGSGVEERVLYHRLNSALFKKIEEEIDEEQQRAVGEGAIATVAVPDHVWLYVGGGGTALAVQMGFQPIAVYCARFGLGVAELQSRFRIDVSGGGVADAGPAKELYIMRWQERPWGSGDF